MPSIRQLFKEQVRGLTKGLYEKSKIYIESQGAINPPRLKALLLASPNSIADLVGITAAAALGIPIGHANRPSDTIFRSNFFLEKPLIGLAGPLAQRNFKNLIRPGRSYYVKQAPAPYQVINQIKDGIKTDPLGTMLRAGRNELRDGTIREIFKKRTRPDDKFGTKYQHLASRSKPLKFDKTFSEWYPVYTKPDKKAAKDELKLGKGFQDRKAAEYEQSAIQSRSPSSRPVGGVSQFDIINDSILEGKYEAVHQLWSDSSKNRVPFVAFEFYGKRFDKNIILPAVISNLSEDIEPTWNAYKYVGSPFNTYRYSGVERSIKFDMKLYANGETSLENLKKNLNKLREMVFPSTEVTNITAGGQDITTGFNPELIFLTISGYYEKLFGFIDGLNISVDDDVPWPTATNNFESMGGWYSHPAVIVVSISMKVIDYVEVEADKNNPSVKKLSYFFSENDLNQVYKIED